MTNAEFNALHSAAALENYAAKHPDFTALCNMLAQMIDKPSTAEVLIEFGNMKNGKFKPFTCASYKAPSIFLDYSGNPEYLIATPPVVVIAKTRNNYNKTKIDFSLLKIESQHEDANGIVVKCKYDTIPCRLVVCS